MVEKIERATKMEKLTESAMEILSVVNKEDPSIPREHLMLLASTLVRLQNTTLLETQSNDLIAGTFIIICEDYREQMSKYVAPTRNLQEALLVRLDGLNR